MSSTLFYTQIVFVLASCSLLTECKFRHFSENFLQKLKQNVLREEASESGPVRENKLHSYSDLSRLTIMEAVEMFLYYDADDSGFLDEAELSTYIRDLLEVTRYFSSCAKRVIET